MNRLEKILDKADELGMAPMLGLFYFGQDQNLRDDEAVKKATENTINWLHEKGYKNVLIEVANECDNGAYDLEIIKADNIHELIEIVKSIEKDGFRFPVSTSYNGRSIPRPNVVKVADFLLLHGNGVKDPEYITEMVAKTKAVEGYRPMPIVFNEDDHYDFDADTNNMANAVRAYASWGYFDFRRDGEAFENGYQSVPVDWGITSERKKAFFQKVKEITGY